MGEKDPLPAVETARYCDVVISLASWRAATPSSHGTKRRGMITVDPIRLLDDDEALPRAEATAALTLDQERPAVLIHSAPAPTATPRPWSRRRCARSPPPRRSRSPNGPTRQQNRRYGRTR